MMAEGGGCFLAGTEILLEDGSVKPIEKIVAGDRILTKSSELSKELIGATVTQTFIHRVDGYMIVNDKIKVTPVHRMFVNGGWQMIGEAKVGDMLLDRDGKPVRINSITWVHEPVTVYNFEVEDLHTYFADGLYVHNEKGGVRENFVDTALFEVVTTDENGQATLTFNLPDNITSWRANIQAIDRETKYAGFSQVDLEATLPFFIQTIMRDSYLSEDEPTVLVRAAGTSLKDQMVSYTIEIEGMDYRKEATVPAQETVRFQLPSLPEGDYRVVVSADAGDSLNSDSEQEFTDSVAHNVHVVRSRLTRPVLSESVLGSGERLKGSENGLTYVTFVDGNRGSLYGDLYRLAHWWGDRADEAAVRQVAAEILNKEFGAGVPEVEVPQAAYQANNGLRLLSYADTDLYLTARMAMLRETPFDEAAMIEYLTGQLYFERQAGRSLSAESAAWAYVGLAALGEPVLAEVQRFAEDESLTEAELIPLALALYYSGDLEGARGLYRELLALTSNEIGYRWVEAEDDETSGERTAWLAILAGGLGEDQRDELYEYVRNQYHGDTLLVLEELVYLKETLGTLEPGAVEVAYTRNGKRESVVLEKGQVVTIPVDAQGLAELDPEARIGTVRVVTSYDEPLTEPETDLTDSIGVTRTYRDYDRAVENEFSEGELIRVELEYRIDPNLPDDYYQLTDVLPSGLTPVTRSIANWTADMNNRDTRCIWYPYQIHNQTVSFFVRNQTYRHACPKNTVVYYARVVTPGSYKAEPAFIRSIHDPSSVNYSEQNETITITE